MEQTTNDIIFEFLEQIDEIYGTYLDAIMGFKYLGFEIEKSQIESSKKFNFSIEYLDSLPHIYGIGDPNDPNSIVLHESTQGEHKERNKVGGLNFLTIAHLCITQIYQYWEDYYRSKIASSLGIEAQKLKSDIFGDLRIYRNSIIHHMNIALPDIEKCKILKWFNTGEEIKITEENLQQIIYEAKVDLNNIPDRYIS